MTITSTTARNDYVGTGTTGPFSYGFRAPTSADITVTKEVAGVITVLAYPADYSVTGVGENTGGTVILTTALAVGAKLTVTRGLDLTQSTSLRNQGVGYASVVEDALDRGIMIDQQQQEEINRTLRLPVTATSVSLTLPAPSTGKHIAWNAGATALENVDLDETRITRLPSSVNPATVSPDLPVPVANQAFFWNPSGTAVESRALSETLSGTTLPGEGRTMILLSDYLANNTVYNVKDYGAVGNGVTNDYPAIAAAISAASAAGGGIVYFPRNSAATGYLTATTINVPSRVWLVGAGRGASRIIGKNTLGVGHQLIVFGAGVTNAGITKLGYKYETGVINSAIGIYMAGAIDCMAVDVYHETGYYWGIFIAVSSAYCVVDNFLSATSGTHGVEINSSTYCEVRNSHIKNAGTGGGGGNGIELYRHNTSGVAIVGCRLTNNTIETCATYGILTSGDQDTAIIGNTIRGCTVGGIYISGGFDGTVAQRGTISNNVLISNSGIGIEVIGQRWTVSGNSVANQSGMAVQITGGIGNSFSGNTFYACGGNYGVYINGGSKNIVSGNVFTDCCGNATDGSGVQVESDDNTCIGNIFHDTRTPTKMDYGVFIAAGKSRNVAIGNRGILDGPLYVDLSGNATNSGIAHPGSYSVLAEMPALPQSTPNNGGLGIATLGLLTWDPNYLYVNTANGAWKRIALTAF